MNSIEKAGIILAGVLIVVGVSYGFFNDNGTEIINTDTDEINEIEQAPQGITSPTYTQPKQDVTSPAYVQPKQNTAIADSKNWLTTLEYTVSKAQSGVDKAWNYKNDFDHFYAFGDTGLNSAVDLYRSDIDWYINAFQKALDIANKDIPRVRGYVNNNPLPSGWESDYSDANAAKGQVDQLMTQLSNYYRQVSDDASQLLARLAAPITYIPPPADYYNPPLPEPEPEPEPGLTQEEWDYNCEARWGGNIGMCTSVYGSRPSA